MKYSGWPDPGELVVGKVTEVEDFGAFVDLIEYEDKEGLVHVSEVSSGWVKYIRDYVREDQTVVCKVLDVDRESHQIDLSIKDVNDKQKRTKIQEWKNEQKADKWVSMALEDEEVDVEDTDEAFTRVAEALINTYGTMYEALEEAAKGGVEVIEEAEVEPEIAESITRVARENVSVPYVEIDGFVDLETLSLGGVDDIKKALEEIGYDGEEEVEIDVEYVSAPEYRITAKAHDYKTAERAVEEAAQKAVDRIRDLGGTGEYHSKSRTAEA
ncbi:MAG: translation initiation factor IF-2 subunit alpha [Halobacteria archaeon]|nr:translation initiation factor IF-2 subunit alpha [Halobacteria archaeon]